MSRKPFVILDSELLNSSIWSEPVHIRILWITLLLLCDTEGYVGAALPGIARMAGITIEQAKEGLAKLMAPDKYSRSQEHEGRRVAEVDRGYQVLNFVAHVDRLSTERKRARDRMRRWRAHGWKGRDGGSVPAPKVGDSCPCCGKTFPTPLKDSAVLDHDHANGKGRAFICRSCNFRVGQYELGKSDQPEYIVEYLGRFGSGTLDVTVTEGKGAQGRAVNIPIPSSLLPSSVPVEQRNQATTTERPGPRANPLMTDRVKAETECLRLCRDLSGDGLAPEDVMGQASEYRGTEKLNPASMTDDRLFQTLRKLRKMKAARPQPTQEDQPECPKAAAAWEPIVAHLEGSMDRHRWASWIRPIRPLGLSNGLLTLGCVDPMRTSFVKGTFGAAIAEAAEAEGLAVKIVSLSLHEAGPRTMQKGE